MNSLTGYIGYISLIAIVVLMISITLCLQLYSSKFPSKNVKFKLDEVKRGNMILYRPLVKRKFWGWSTFKIKQDGKTIIADKAQFHSKEGAERYIEFYKKIKGVK
jgi:hypothetical protein